MIVGINQESSTCIPILIQIFYSHNMVVGRASLLKLTIPPASASEPEVRDVRLARIRRGSIRMKGVEKGTLTYISCPNYLTIPHTLYLWNCIRRRTSCGDRHQGHRGKQDHQT